jgi:hypothetical protein
MQSDSGTLTNLPRTGVLYVALLCLSLPDICFPLRQHGLKCLILKTSLSQTSESFHAVTTACRSLRRAQI